VFIFINLVNKNKDFFSILLTSFYNILNGYIDYRFKFHLIKDKKEFFFNNLPAHFYNILISFAIVVFSYILLIICVT